MYRLMKYSTFLYGHVQNLKIHRSAKKFGLAVIIKIRRSESSGGDKKTVFSVENTIFRFSEASAFQRCV